MNQTLMLLLPIVGIFALGCSITLLALGRMIDSFPTINEDKRVKSLASPVTSTRIAVASFWLVFGFGIITLLQGTRFGMIVGITSVFAAVLFMFTAVGFSFAVLSTMRNQRCEIRVASFPRKE